MKWSEIYGDKKTNHDIKIPTITKEAQARFNEIKWGAESVVSLHITGKIRVYGVRDRKILNIIWYDPWHDKADDGVCPSVRN